MKNLNKRVNICCLGLILIMSLALSAAADECQVDVSRQNVVKFISDAPIESFEGVTSKIDGYVVWDGAGFDAALKSDSLAAKSEFYFEVDLNTIDTGIGLRNRHMRENYLETDKKPEYRFTHYQGRMTQVSAQTDSTGKSYYRVMTDGAFFVHGVSQDYKIELAVIPQGNDVYRIKSEFTVPLSKFKIEIPTLMFYKIDENMEIVLDFYVKKATQNNKE